MPWEPPRPVDLPRAAPGGSPLWDQFRTVSGDYGRTALEREAAMVRGTLPGGRNHALNRAAFSVGQLVERGDLDRAEAYRTLYAAGIAAGLTEQEVRRTLASGFTGGAAKPRAPQMPSGLWLPAGAARAQDEQPAQEQAEAPDLNAEVRAHLPILDWHALFAEDVADEWIVEPLIPARRLVSLYSAPKVGKSLLMLELAVHISRGTSVLGYQPDRPRRVLYVDFENDPRGDIRHRLAAMGFRPDDLAGLAYLSFPNLAALDTDQGGQQLHAAAKTYGCELVAVDTVSRAIKGEENENDTWLNLYRHTGRRLKADGLAMVRLDHSGKDETRGQRGGSAKSGDVDMVWRMSKVTEHTFRLDCEAARLPVIEKTLVIHRDLTPRLAHRVDAEGRYAAWRVKVDEIEKAADAAGLARSIGRVKLREWVRSSGLTASDRVLEEVVKRRKGIDRDED